jgi:inorganic pyrophosphatase
MSQGHTTDSEDTVDVLVEIPRGSRNKYEFDFATYKYLQDIKTDLKGWDDRAAAWRVIDEARDVYRRGLDLPRF